MIKAVNGIVDTLSRLTNNSAVAGVTVTLTAFYASFFVPILPIILCSFGLTLLDCYYGIRVAKRYGVIDSRKSWFGTIRKFKDLFLVFLAARAIELYVLMGVFEWALAGAFGIVVCITELWSVLENLNTLDPTGPWKVFSKYMKNKAEQYIGTDITEELNSKRNASIKRTKTKNK